MVTSLAQTVQRARRWYPFSVARPDDDPTMSWMDDQEYLAAWKAEHEADPEEPRPAKPAAEVAAAVATDESCPRCHVALAGAREVPVADGRSRRWHRECARQALSAIASNHPATLCPGCGEKPPASGYLFDGARKWHVTERCTGAALREL
jgi:hypothetical protein